MEVFNEYSLLIAVAMPVVVIVGINLILALTGETGTLLLPSLRGYPAIDLTHVEATPEVATPAAAPAPPALVDDPANHREHDYREAA